MFTTTKNQRNQNAIQKRFCVISNIVYSGEQESQGIDSKMLHSPSNVSPPTLLNTETVYQHINKSMKRHLPLNISLLLSTLTHNNCPIHELFNELLWFILQFYSGTILPWQAQRLPIQVVQQLAGHTSITTTRNYYLAVRSEDLQSASKWINKILARRYSDWRKTDANGRIWGFSY